jgi:hypothetical protein
MRDPMEMADPPAAGPAIAALNNGFAIKRWEAGRRASFAANDFAPGGRPFVDGVEIELGRPLRDQAIDLELGKADVVELGPAELRRAAGRRVWTSSPVRLVALLFGSRVEDVRVREALGLAVDRAAIHSVLLQRQGEISGALLPQWLSGFAFLFRGSADMARARALVAEAPASARAIRLGIDDPQWQTVAARIALNARDAGLAVTVAPAKAAADVRLVEVRIESGDAPKALAGVAAALGLGEPARAESPEALAAAERTLLEGFRVIPLFHLPYVYGVGPRVKGGPGITPLGEWRFENLWIEASRP